MGSKPGRKYLAALIVLLVLIADRVTKELAPGIPEGGMVLIPGVIGLRYTENQGIAFSLLSGYPRLLGAVSLLLIAGGWWLLRKKRLAPLPLYALMLMLGGALGNVPDRLIRGYVPDMIEVLFVRFAVFNVADACLTIGCALLIISLLLRPKDWEGVTK